jgi:hypothetical protein
MALCLWYQWAVNPEKGNLRGSTANSYMNGGIAAYYNHIIITAATLGVALSSPVLSKRVKSMGSIAKNWFQKAEKLSMRPYLWEEVEGVIEHGVDWNTPYGFYCFMGFICNLIGMIRRVAAYNLRVSYYIEETPQGPVVHFLPDSEIYIFKSKVLKMDVIVLKHELDKNLNTYKRACTCMPGHIPRLHLDVAGFIRTYLIRLRPPSLHLGTLPPRNPLWGRGHFADDSLEQDGLLLAKPCWKAGKVENWTYQDLEFKRVASEDAAQCWKDMFIRAFPERAIPQVLKRIGSYSGRKTMALWLWAASKNIQLLADAGHWALMCKQAIHAYMYTPWMDIVMLKHCLKNRGPMHALPEDNCEEF